MNKTIYETDDKVFREECERLAKIHGETLKKHIRDIIEIQKPLIILLQKFREKGKEFDTYTKQDTGTISLKQVSIELLKKDEEYKKLSDECLDLLDKIDDLK